METKQITDLEATFLAHQRELLDESISSEDEDFRCEPDNITPERKSTRSSIAISITNKIDNKLEDTSKEKNQDLNEEKLMNEQNELPEKSNSITNESICDQSETANANNEENNLSVKNNNDNELINQEKEENQDLNEKKLMNENEQNELPEKSNSITVESICDQLATADQEQNSLSTKNNSEKELVSEKREEENQALINVTDFGNPSIDKLKKLADAVLPATVLAKIQPATSTKSETGESATTKKFEAKYRYGRDQLFTIQKSRTEDEWVAYLWNNHGHEERPFNRNNNRVSTGAWPINDFPFELDAEMRCSVSEQLRVQRQREAERRRWLAAGKHHQVVVSGTTPTTTAATKPAWGDPNAALSSGCELLVEQGLTTIFKQQKQQQPAPACVYAVSTFAQQNQPKQQVTEGKDKSAKKSIDQASNRSIASPVMIIRKSNNKKVSEKQLAREKQVADEKQRMLEISQKVLNDTNIGNKKKKHEQMKKEELMAQIKKEQKQKQPSKKGKSSEEDWIEAHQKTMAMAKSAILEGQNEWKQLEKQSGTEEKQQKNRWGIESGQRTNSEMERDERGRPLPGALKLKKQLKSGNKPVVDKRGKRQQQASTSCTSDLLNATKAAAGGGSSSTPSSTTTTTTTIKNRWAEQYYENKTSSSSGSNSSSGISDLEDNNVPVVAAMPSSALSLLEGKHAADGVETLPKQKFMVEFGKKEQKNMINALNGKSGGECRKQTAVEKGNILHLAKTENFIEANAVVVDPDLQIPFFTVHSWHQYLDATNKWLHEWNLSQGGPQRQPGQLM